MTIHRSIHYSRYEAGNFLSYPLATNGCNTTYLKKNRFLQPFNHKHDNACKEFFFLQAFLIDKAAALSKINNYLWSVATKDF